MLRLATVLFSMFKLLILLSLLSEFLISELLIVPERVDKEFAMLSRVKV